MKRLLALLALGFAMLAGPALASNCSTYPYTLTNGQTADANQVMANFNSILSCANGNLIGSGSVAGGSLQGTYPNPTLASGAVVTNLGYTPLDAAGSVPATGEQTFLQSTTGSASINIPQGLVPSAPNNGDIWTTSSGAFVQIAGITLQFANPASTAVSSFNTRTGAVTLNSTDVTTALAYTPLKPSNNLSDVSSAATSRTNLGAAALASPAFTGTPTAPTAAGGTNTTQLATTAFVQSALPVAATTSTAGIVALSTNAQAQTGTNTTTAVTPAAMVAGMTNTNLGTNGFTRSGTTSGYITLPGGLIEQWGTTGSVLSGGGTLAVTFPTAFGTASYGVVVTRTVTPTGTGSSDTVTAISTTGFTVENGANQNTTFYYISFGR